MKTELIVAIAGAFAGALIAGLIGLLSSRWDRSRVGRNRFLAEIGILKSDLEAALDKRPANLKEFHVNSCDQIRRAVFAVQPFISDVSFGLLLELLRKYKLISDQQLDVMKLSIGKRLQQSKLELPAHPVKDSEELLRERLAEFQKIVG